MKKRVSLIILVFNEGRFRGRYLRSILRQNIHKSDCNIIALNDGVKDNTLNLLTFLN